MHGLAAPARAEGERSHRRGSGASHRQDSACNRVAPLPGRAKLVTGSRSDRLLGAHIAAPNAVEIVGEAALAALFDLRVQGVVGLDHQHVFTPASTAVLRSGWASYRLMDEGLLYLRLGASRTPPALTAAHSWRRGVASRKARRRAAPPHLQRLRYRQSRSPCLMQRIRTPAAPGTHQGPLISSAWTAIFRPPSTDTFGTRSTQAGASLEPIDCSEARAAMRSERGRTPKPSTPQGPAL